MINESIKIAFIDSGVNYRHPAFNFRKITGVTILNDGSVVKDEFEDEIGHGTGVVYNFTHYFDESECFMVKIFNDRDEVDEQKIIYALKYILDNYQCHIINISCGISRCCDIEQIKYVCDELFDRGTIIVAAYDNGGSLSYPACFNNVIGVDISTSCFKKTQYQYVDSELVNIRGFGYQQKLPSLEKSYQICSGSSFVAPYISALVARCIQNGIKSLSLIKEELKKNSCKKYCGSRDIVNSPQFTINKAIAFPFNKEMHALLAFSSCLNYELVDIYDYKFNGKVGKKVFDEIKRYYSDKDYIIKNIEAIDWTSFDTLILGHTSKIELAIGQDIKKRIIRKCIELKKNLYFYDDDDVDTEMLMNNKSCYLPIVNEKHVRIDQFGKLYEIAKPVVGFFGTSPKQGKMTTLLLTRKYLQDNNYKVGTLGTEPNSFLLGLEQQYNMGFNSTVELSGDYAIEYINSLMHNIELKNPDIIFVASQSQTVCINSGNLGFYPHSQYELLLGTQPDAFIININIFDDDNYILRTMQFLESACEGTVLCLVVFPVKYDNYQGHLIGKGIKYTSEVLNDEVKRISELTKKPVFLMDDNVGENIAKICVEYFEVTEEEEK